MSAVGRRVVSNGRNVLGFVRRGEAASIELILPEGILLQPGDFAFPITRHSIPKLTNITV